MKLRPCQDMDHGWIPRSMKSILRVPPCFGFHGRHVLGEMEVEACKKVLGKMKGCGAGHCVGGLWRLLDTGVPVLVGGQTIGNTREAGSAPTSDEWKPTQQIQSEGKRLEGGEEHPHPPTRRNHLIQVQYDHLVFSRTFQRAATIRIVRIRIVRIPCF